VNRTTKTVLAVAGILVLSYPAIAWMMGIAIEGRIQQGEQQSLDQVPYLRLLKREYHRGVYRSTEIATYGFRIPVPAVKASAGTLIPSATITIVSQIQHGPFPGLRTTALATVDSTLVGPPALQKELSGALGSKPILRLHTTVGFFGGATADLTSPAFSVRLGDGSTLTWGGLTASGTTTRNQARWSGQLSAPRLALQGPRGGIELTGLEYSGSHAKAFDGLYLGTGTLTIEKLDGSSPRSGVHYSLERIAITNTAKAAGEFVDMRVDIAADAAQIAAVIAKNVIYSVSFEHVHGPSLASMAQAVRAVERRPRTDPTQLATGMQAAFRQYGGELLLHDPVIEIRQLGFTMPEGSFLLSARLSAPGLSPADLQWPAVVLALKSHARVTADLKVDDGLVQKMLATYGASPRFAGQLTSLEQQGYLTTASGALATHLEYSGGRLALNGHPFPPAAPTN
jgi:uncharacterized protein YdgA (DUF945 family)